jgi:hypothetical protein
LEKDIKLWEETILPKVEERIGKEWSYSNNEEEAPDELGLEDLINEKETSTNS